MVNPLRRVYLENRHKTMHKYLLQEGIGVDRIEKKALTKPALEALSTLERAKELAKEPIPCRRWLLTHLP